MFVLFNSYLFIFIFLPLTFIIYFYLNYKKLTKVSSLFLIFASLFFYSWWNILYLPLILGSILFNYLISKKLNKFNPKKLLSKKLLLTFGVIANVTLLGYFKYTDFLIENFNLLMHTQHQLLHLSLPLAISFFTFQQISYLIDSYHKRTGYYSFREYTLFVTFFPQLIAGPIVHHQEMIPQFFKYNSTLKNYKNIALGLFIFSIGLFKKVIIADTFASWANQGFDIATTLNLIVAWTVSLSYTFQLYFDFSGYTDMAIGLALLFNIQLPINFNSPYKSTDIQDFWRRWHITLGRFLRDYIYIPLGGNQKGLLLTYLNLLITFIIGGIWHGAGWTFVFWGFLHGMALVIHRIWQQFGIKLWRWVAWLITFNFINISWIFFRAKEWEDAIKILKAMFSLENIAIHPKVAQLFPFLNDYSNIHFSAVFPAIAGDGWTLISIVITFIILLKTQNSMEKLKNFKHNYKTLLFTVVIFIISLFSLNKVSDFLYFNF